MAAQPTYSAILAAHNEAGTIGPLVGELRSRLGAEAEILVVDDGSEDGTSERAVEAGATVLRHAVNRGKGAAIRTGIAAASGAIAVLMDVDGQDLADDVPALLKPLCNGADFVIGSKFIGVRRPGSISTVNALGNRFMSLVINGLYGARLTDTQSGFKAARLELLKSLDLRADEYDIESEMLAKALMRGARVVEVPVVRDRRQAGRSGLKRVRHGLKILAMILRVRVAERASGRDGTAREA
ncbi:MAG: glycosyltransferase family 2 protein [Myxococcales bacterium]|nr:MAG: glycosyltransferase family 2 protein [Myxococcales bacterium]